jgi:hypothetical protein
VGTNRALDSAIGLPSKSSSESWMLGFATPLEVSRSFTASPDRCRYACQTTSSAAHRLEGHIDSPRSAVTLRAAKQKLAVTHSEVPNTWNRRPAYRSFRSSVGYAVPHDFRDHQGRQNSRSVSYAQPNAAARGSAVGTALSGHAFEQLREFSSVGFDQAKKGAGRVRSACMLSAKEVFTFRPHPFSRLVVAEGCIAGLRPPG